MIILFVIKQQIRKRFLMMTSKVLVTGGSGFVGKRLKKYKPNWIYISSKQYNLINEKDCDQMLNDIKPDAILHLASKVGGIKENSLKQAEFYYNNTMINTNVLECARRHDVQRVLSSLSTCAFPNILPNYPFSEEDLFNGPPAETNFSYGYTKRALHVQTLSYRKQYGLNYSTFCPSNIYGPEDNFNPESSHFVPALVRKISENQDGDTLEFWGTGESLRQQLYVDDLVRIIPILLEQHNSEVPLIVSPNKNLSILEMIKIGLKKANKDVKIAFSGQLDGQYRKDGSNKKLISILVKFNFTSFEEGFNKTYESYNKKGKNE